jgi:ribonucleoside-diphosphate reductase alpha chain
MLFLVRDTNQSRPEILTGRTIRVRSPFGTVYVTLNENAAGVPSELFLNTGKCGSDLAANAEAIGRLCSLLLNLPSTVSEIERLQSIVQCLHGIGGAKRDDSSVRSVPDAVALALLQYLQTHRRVDA